MLSFVLHLLPFLDIVKWHPWLPSKVYRDFEKHGFKARYRFTRCSGNHVLCGMRYPCSKCEGEQRGRTCEGEEGITGNRSMSYFNMRGS